MSSEYSGDVSRRRALATLVAAPGILRGADEFFGRRLEPQRNRVLHGAGQSPDALKEYSDHIGETKPVVYMTYRGLKRAKYLHGDSEPAMRAALRAK